MSRSCCWLRAPHISSLLRADLAMAKAGHEMAVDHSGRLHERVADRRTDEAKAAATQVGAERVGLRRSRRHFLDGLSSIVNRLAADEAPHVRIEAAELALHREKRLGVGDSGLDLQAIADDAFIGKQ